MSFFSQFLTIVLVFNAILFPVFSQEENKLQIHKCARIEAGLATQFRSENDDSKLFPGATFQYCYGIKTGKKLGLGLGLGFGFQYFEKESFVPFFIDAVYFINQRKYPSFLNLKAGYAMGWSRDYTDYQNSTFKGGPALGIGFGKKIIYFNQMSMYLCAKYEHQFAVIKYEDDLQKMEEKSLHYNMFIIALGFMLEE